jgi:hypothetical protein
MPHLIAPPPSHAADDAAMPRCAEYLAAAAAVSQLPEFS